MWHWVQAQGRVAMGAFYSLGFRPRRPLAWRVQFGGHRGGTYALLLPLFLFASVGEMPISMLLASRLIPSPAWRAYFHLAMGALWLYTLLWILADRWWMARTAAALGEGVLALRWGLRLSTDVPLTQLVHIERVAASQPLPKPAPGFLRVTAFDRPNVLLQLKAGTTLHVQRMASSGPEAVQTLALYVDQPEAFITACRPAIMAATQSAAPIAPVACS